MGFFWKNVYFPILFASKLARVVARAGLNTHRAEHVILVAGDYVLAVIRQDDVAAQRVGVVVFVPPRPIVRQTRYRRVAQCAVVDRHVIEVAV